VPDRRELKAIAADLRRIAEFLDGYVRAGEDRPDVLAAGAANLSHITGRLLGAGEGTAVTVSLGPARSRQNG